MSCGVIVDFWGGRVGFVRMELWAGIVTNALIRTEIGANMPYNGSKMERI
jgi:hypothetical protein